MYEEEYEKYFKYKMKRQEDFYQAFELGAFGDDLPKLAEDEVNKIVKTEWEYNKLQNNWNELKKCTKETKEELEKNIGCLTAFDKGALVAIRVIYKKIQELEEWKEC